MEERLTVKNAAEPGYFLRNQGPQVTVQELEKVINKCGQLEDLEDEFEIGILTVVEAVKKGFYDRTGAFHDPYTFSIDLESSCLRETYVAETSMCPYPDVFYFDEYGKGWALTKEELE